MYASPASIVDQGHDTVLSSRIVARLTKLRPRATVCSRSQMFRELAIASQLADLDEAAWSSKFVHATSCCLPESLMPAVRHDWTRDEVHALFDLPFAELARRAQLAHAEHHDPTKVQLATLSNIKQGGCPEDCAYCPQAARYHTGVDASPPCFPVDEVVRARPRSGQGTRCIADFAWERPGERVKDGESLRPACWTWCAGRAMTLGMEVCVTLGMLDEHQAQKARRGRDFYAYNHNLDTSPEHYGDIISTRTYQDRLDTIAQRAQKPGSPCAAVASWGWGKPARRPRGLAHHPGGVAAPSGVGARSTSWCKAPGTPLEDAESIDVFEYLRTIAVSPNPDA